MFGGAPELVQARVHEQNKLCDVRPVTSKSDEQRVRPAMGVGRRAVSTPVCKITCPDKTICFVLGSSRRMSELTQEERAVLDSVDNVAVLNMFICYWDVLGVRPTHWAHMDCYDPKDVDNLYTELLAIKEDKILASRLIYRFVNCRDTAIEVDGFLTELGVEVSRFRRGYYFERREGPADEFGRAMLQCGSSITGLINIMHILNPGSEIRLVGCEYGHDPGHFYDLPGQVTGMDDDAYKAMRDRMWEGFGILSEFGVNIVDCNKAHDYDIPVQWELPRKELLDGFEVSFE